MPPSFLDTNILLRHLLQDNVSFSPKATAIIGRVEQGELTVHTTDTVVFEAVFTLQRMYRQPRERIAATLLPILDLPGIVLPGKRDYREVFGLYCSTSVGFADCYHAVRMRRLGITEVFSFDRDFDRLPGLRRRED